MPLLEIQIEVGRLTGSALELAAKPFADTPANCTEESTPGCCLAISPIWRTTASVRSIEAAGGSVSLHQGNIGDAEDCERVVEAAKKGAATRAKAKR